MTEGKVVYTTAQRPAGWVWLVPERGSRWHLYAAPSWGPPVTMCGKVKTPPMAPVEAGDFLVTRAQLCRRCVEKWEGGKYLENELAWRLEQARLPEPEREYKLTALGPAGYRFDFAWPGSKLVVEVEGGVWIRGRHNQGAGFQRDMLKYNAVTLAGWALLRFDRSLIFKGTAVDQVARYLEEHPALTWRHPDAYYRTLERSKYEQS